MNYSMIVFILGHLLKFEAVFLILPTIVGFIYRETDAFVYLGLSLGLYLLGTVFTYKRSPSKQFYPKEGFVTVAFGWIVLSIFGALPFVLTGDIPSYIYFMLFFISVLLISIDNFDFTTNFTAVAATLNNIGPGLSKVGPTCNFSCYSIFSKMILMFNMLAGRLELFPMIFLLLPDTWKRSR